MVSTTQLLDFFKNLEADAQETVSDSNKDDVPSIEQSKRGVIAQTDAELNAAHQELTSAQEALKRSKDIARERNIRLSTSKDVQVSKRSSDEPKTEFEDSLAKLQSSIVSFEDDINLSQQKQIEQAQNKRKRGARLPAIIAILTLIASMIFGSITVTSLLILAPIGFALIAIELRAQSTGFLAALTRLAYIAVGIFCVLTPALTVFGLIPDILPLGIVWVPMSIVLAFSGVWMFWKGIRNKLPLPSDKQGAQT